MKTTDFTYLLEHPEEINRSQIGDFRTVIDQFPYFQPARALYLKALKINDSFLYNQELKTTAAFTTDRSVLFDFITSEEFAQNEISDLIQHNLEHLREIELNEYEDLSVNISKEQTEKATSIESKPTPIEQLAGGLAEKPVEPEKKLQMGKPLEFDKAERHSFSEWLKLTGFQPISREEDVVSEDKTDTNEDGKRLKQQQIIDEFIDSNPTIPPVKSDRPQTDLASQRLMKPDSLMTETLARIYLEQGNHEKAKQAYRILSLKYPEKSSFFADQIQAIEELENK
ncbi:MAG: hypothetical protein HKO67_03865 [Flavobacteriaceae bacterium]|nr:hypothetical protein [Flavobacteriaceae bacterium]